MKGTAGADHLLLSALLVRAFGLLLLWIILIGPALQNLPLGVAASAAGVWVSTLLWPPGGNLSWTGLARFLLRFLPQSVVAGLDVARRAFARVPDLHPGIANCRSTIPDGLARDSACAVMSLQPGKLPVAADPDGMLHIHCLDLREAVAAQVAADEAVFRRMLKPERRDG
jgi:multicomponent Na+:H+ antiporter subunit E